MSDVKLPKTLQISKTLSASASKRDQISNEGFIKFVVTKAENREGRNKDMDGNEKVSRLQIVLTMAPLKDPNDPKSAVHELALKKYMVLPMRGPTSPEPADEATEEKAQKDTLKRLAKDLRCLIGTKEIPYAPKKLPNGSYEYDGQEIDKEDYEKAVTDLYDRAQEIVAKYWADSDRWLTPRKACWAKVAQKPGLDGVVRPEISWFVTAVPEDAQPLTHAEWFKSPAK